MTGDGACQLGCLSIPFKLKLTRTAYSVTNRIESRTMGYSRTMVCTHVWCVHFLKRRPLGGQQAGGSAPVTVMPMAASCSATSMPTPCSKWITSAGGVQRSALQGAAAMASCSAACCSSPAADQAMENDQTGTHHQRGRCLQWRVVGRRRNYQQPCSEQSMWPRLSVETLHQRDSLPRLPAALPPAAALEP